MPTTRLTSFGAHLPHGVGLGIFNPLNCACGWLGSCVGSRAPCRERLALMGDTAGSGDPVSGRLGGSDGMLRARGHHHRLLEGRPHPGRIVPRAPQAVLQLVEVLSGVAL